MIFIYWIENLLGLKVQKYVEKTWKYYTINISP